MYHRLRFPAIIYCWRVQARQKESFELMFLQSPHRLLLRSSGLVETMTSQSSGSSPVRHTSSSTTKLFISTFRMRDQLLTLLDTRPINPFKHSNSFSLLVTRAYRGEPKNFKVVQKQKH